MQLLQRIVGGSISFTYDPLWALGQSVLYENLSELSFAYFRPAVRGVEEGKLLFAVKTTRKFHTERIPLLEATWAKDERLVVEYFTDSAEDFPVLTKNRMRNIEVNTKKGHCLKLLTILETLYQSEQDLFILSDNDTLWSVDRLLTLVKKFTKEPLYFGERYGFSAHLYAAQLGLHKTIGYDFLTTGSGVVLNRAALDVLFNTTTPFFCRNNDDADDMVLGEYFFQKLPLIHSNAFKQRRPEEYPSFQLDQAYYPQQPVITFHQVFSPLRKWQPYLSPLEIYNKYLQPTKQCDPLAENTCH